MVWWLSKDVQAGYDVIIIADDGAIFQRMTQLYALTWWSDEHLNFDNFLILE